ncbi:MAG: Holliday junction branch migration protein RuvA [Gammaproteobacteria bacterium]|nr:Holliday junction branch migration protein RuvA [Gammaproteobacteria bacterium]
MIGSLRGKILKKNPPQILVEVNGIGYEIETPMSTFYHLPADEKEIFLYTHLVVREDAHLLFGFYQERDRVLFRHLIKVSGIGPKVALAILSGMDSDSFMRSILDNDTGSLTRIPGVGKKTAERLVIEMRDKLAAFGEINLSTGILLNNGEPAGSEIADAISALVSLGYKPEQARRAVTNAPAGCVSSEAIIRYALKAMA